MQWKHVINNNGKAPFYKSQVWSNNNIIYLSTKPYSMFKFDETEQNQKYWLKSGEIDILNIKKEISIQYHGHTILQQKRSKKHDISN